MPLRAPYARSAWVTWMHSSRVGVSTSAWTSSSVGSTDSQQRQAERGRLAGAGLGLADHVAALEQRRDRLLLDRARRLVADVVEGLQEWLGQPELGEGRHSERSRLAVRERLPSRRLMSLTVVGSIAFDAVETESRQARPPARRRRRALLARLLVPRRDPRRRPGRRRLRRGGVRRAAQPRREHRRRRARPGRQDVLLGRPLRARREHPPHAADRPQRLRALRAQALATPRATRTSCSWPTSSPTCSAPCASSAPARASRRWTR